jgi:LuxR family maltose regulon positive regulatory protein
VARFTSYQASRWILLGRLDDARRWASSFDASMQGDARLHKPGILTLARLRLVKGDPEAASLLLLRLLSIVERVGLAQDAIGIHILLALAQQGAHRSAQAERELRQALALAEPEGYRRIFLDEGAPLAALLETRLSGGAGGSYVRSLLADLRSAATRETGQLSPLVEPLTRREQEVVHLIAEGASNQEISEALVIALGTVKKHITTIFAKVGVTSRTQLLARARELGLLQL